MKIVVALLLAILSFSFVMDVQAKRFGGGRSFGTSRSVSNYSRSAAAPAGAPMQNAAASPARSWLGPLAGLAAGGLLASLFMGHGLASGIGTWLLVLGAGFFIWRLFAARRSSPVTQSMSNMNFNSPFQSAPQAAAATATAPDFDAEDFMRKAKAQFIRLQAAYDSKNLADIREFTMPEVFAEIQLQLQERGNAENITEVVSLNAALLGVDNSDNDMFVGVRFSGLIKEDHEQAQPFIETWHFKRDNQTWKVAGLQQEINA